MNLTTSACSAATSGRLVSWYAIRADSPKRCWTSERMIAVISSGDQDGPQPPPQQSASAGKSNTSTVTIGSVIVVSYPILTAPVGQNLAQTAQPVQSDSSTM